MSGGSWIQRRARVAGMMVCASLLLTACGTLQPPQPWQRGLLAKPGMRLEADPLQQRFDQHIQTSGTGEHPTFHDKTGRAITTHQPHAPPRC